MQGQTFCSTLNSPRNIPTCNNCQLSSSRRGWPCKGYPLPPWIWVLSSTGCHNVAQKSQDERHAKGTCAILCTGRNRWNGYLLTRSLVWTVLQSQLHAERHFAWQEARDPNLKTSSAICLSCLVKKTVLWICVCECVTKCVGFLHRFTNNYDERLLNFICGGTNDNNCSKRCTGVSGSPADLIWFWQRCRHHPAKCRRKQA